MGCNPGSVRRNTVQENAHRTPEDLLKQAETVRLKGINVFDNDLKIKNANFIKQLNSDIEKKYQVLGRIGRGSFGKVYKVLHIESGLIRAMKSINREQIDKNGGFMKEIEILTKLDHPNILKVFEYYIDDINYYLFTEYISGGELVECISQWKDFDESKSAYIFQQIISAVFYLHSKNICHRDIKLENILVENDKNSDKINVKLIDFGTCCYMKSFQKLKTKVGTPFYIAPEVLSRNYTEKCDMWSCGVVLYFLLVGYPPFTGKSMDDIFVKIEKAKYSLSGSEWDKVSQAAKDLVKSLLEKNDSKRPSAQDCLNHKWFTEYLRKSTLIDKEYAGMILKNIKNFKAKEKIQQATLAFIVHFLGTHSEVEKLKKMFKLLDKSGDGRLTYQELKEGFEKIMGKCISEVEFIQIINNIDQDKDGFIEYEEFLRVCISSKTLITEENLRQAFYSFDGNNDGKLSVDELKQILGTSDNELVEELIHNIDGNQNGFVSYDDFRDIMKKILDKKSQTFCDIHSKSLDFRKYTNMHEQEDEVK